MESDKYSWTFLRKAQFWRKKCSLIVAMMSYRIPLGIFIRCSNLSFLLTLCLISISTLMQIRKSLPMLLPSCWFHSDRKLVDNASELNIETVVNQSDLSTSWSQRPDSFLLRWRTVLGCGLRREAIPYPNTWKDHNPPTWFAHLSTTQYAGGYRPSGS